MRHRALVVVLAAALLPACIEGELVWQPAEKIGDHVAWGGGADVAAGPAGELVAVWYVFPSTVQAAVRDRFGRWRPAEHVTDDAYSHPPRVAFDVQGRANVFWIGPLRPYDVGGLYFSRLEAGVWTQPILLSDPLARVRSMMVTGEGEPPWLAWSSSGALLVSRPEGEGWSAPETVATDPYGGDWMITALSDDGRDTLIAWNDYGRKRIAIRRDGRWEETADPGGRSVVRLQAALGRGGLAVATWYEGFDDAWRVALRPRGGAWTTVRLPFEASDVVLTRNAAGDVALVASRWEGVKAWRIVRGALVGPDVVAADPTKRYDSVRAALDPEGGLFVLWREIESGSPLGSIRAFHQPRPGMLVDRLLASEHAGNGRIPGFPTTVTSPVAIVPTPVHGATAFWTENDVNQDPRSRGSKRAGPLFAQSATR